VEASPANRLPAVLLFRLFTPHSNFTLVVDDQPVGEIGKIKEKVFQVEPGGNIACTAFLSACPNPTKRECL
jgi:hypothetical protein